MTEIPVNYVKDYDSREPKSQARLTDVGTRFEHLNDIFDLWTCSIETVKNSLKSFPNQSESMLLARLEAAVRLLQEHREKLSGWDSKQWGLHDELQKAGLHPDQPLNPKPSEDKK
jgi:hypothetical protein